MKVDFKKKFKKLLELSCNLSTGPFDEQKTQFSEFGFFLSSQVASLNVHFNPATGDWRVRTYCETFNAEEGEDIVQTGWGWNNLIRYLCVDSDTTWFCFLTKEQINSCMM